jgi:hypothetical protein
MPCLKNPINTTQQLPFFAEAAWDTANGVTIKTAKKGNDSVPVAQYHLLVAISLLVG